MKDKRDFEGLFAGANHDFGQGIFIGMILAELIWGLFFWNINKKADYYAPAEWLFTTESSSYFAVENGNIYAVAADPGYTDDHPYLLHMDPNNTTEPTDDIVLVVWETK